jgi:site-specific recombinase XerD
MKTHNSQNERIKRAYFTYLTEAQGYSEATLDGVAKALNRFETYTRFRDFKAFHIEQAKGFKAHLSEQQNLRSKTPLSKATLYATLSALKRFFLWLAGQPGYKSRISYSDADYFNLSAKDTRIAKTHRDSHVPTLEQIRHVIRAMPAITEIEHRDRALIAFTILTGVATARSHPSSSSTSTSTRAGSTRTHGRSRRSSPSRSRPGSFPSATTSARSSSTGSGI